MTAAAPQSAQRLPAYLPAIYREDPFCARYLLRFEQALVGRRPAHRRALRNSSTPTRTDPEFLPWLSSWDGLHATSRFRAHPAAPFSPRASRRCIAARGTLQNLQELLTDLHPRWRAHDHRSTGEAALLQGLDAPAERSCRTCSSARSAIAHALIDLAKPAHTLLRPDVAAMFPHDADRRHLTIGVDTLLGSDSGAASTSQASFQGLENSWLTSSDRITSRPSSSSRRISTTSRLIT